MVAFEARVLDVVRRLRPGEVTTYGEVAAEAGSPGAARAVGNALRGRDDVPWWRVVTASGRCVPHLAAQQARLLAAEGVVVTDGRVRASGHTGAGGQATGPADGVSGLRSPRWPGGGR